MVCFSIHGCCLKKRLLIIKTLEIMAKNNTYGPETSIDVVLNKEQYKHEQNQLKEQHSYDLSRQEKDNAHIREIEKTRLGLVGRLFGSGGNASKNIAATICILLILCAGVVSLYAYIWKDDKESARAIWGVIAPILTLSLGYVFGKK